MAPPFASSLRRVVPTKTVGRLVYFLCHGPRREYTAACASYPPVGGRPPRPVRPRRPYKSPVGSQCSCEGLRLGWRLSIVSPHVTIATRLAYCRRVLTISADV